MATTSVLNDREDNAITRYARKALWGNPEYDKQFQVKMWRVTPDIGAVNHFRYMGKWRPTPQVTKQFHIFTVGGTHPGIWNLGARFKGENPFNTWVSASIISRRRGVQLDFYNGLGKQFPRTKTWVLFTHDGLVLVAFERIKVFPITVADDMHFRCYSTDLTITKSTDALADKGNPYVFESMTYENNVELGRFVSRLGVLKGRAGFTGVFHNGLMVATVPTANELTIGDVVEIWHDPTVRRVLYYNYSTLKDYYSDLDKQRKFILHPPKDGDFTLRYFDDNDYYFLDKNGKGIYYHRNVESAVRQLTHADVALSVGQLNDHMVAWSGLRDIATAKIMVLERDTTWLHEWPWEHQRVRHLYRMSDANILKAMTGERSVMPEWTAPELENGPVAQYIRSQIRDTLLEPANLALGYNAETLAVSQTPMSAAYEAGTGGVRVPSSYQETSTVWEYNASGQLLGYYWITNALYVKPRFAGCAKLEFTYGKGSRNLHYDLTNKDIKLTNTGEIRVYTIAYSVLAGSVVGGLTDVTGTDLYRIDNGTLVWDKLDRVNQRGLVIYDDTFLCHEFDIDHLDHSLCFSLDDVYSKVIGNWPINFAQIDVWINGYPLIDEVDWIFRDRRIFINNRQFLKAGAQRVVIRCFGQWSDMTKPKTECELGFVEGGVIGNQPRYNIREDRATRIVVGGKLMLLEELRTAETDNPDDYNYPLNGLPYMVKHTYTPVKGAKDYDFHYLYDRSRETDKRVVDYLTLYCPKPPITVDFNMGEKYMLYSPFMNVVVNAIVNNVLRVPTKGTDEEFYSDQTVSELVQAYKWWLPYDPITMNYDLRYFGILPYANVEKLAVTSDQFTFLKQINKLYLKNVLSIEGYFEVAQNV